MIYGQPISASFWVGSATTYQDKNPSFQVVTVDAKTMIPLEMETYYLDITKANKKNKPTWELQKTYTEFFDLEDLSPKSIMDYAERVYTDVDVAKKYRDQRYNDGPMSFDEAPCEFHECQNKWYC